MVLKSSVSAKLKVDMVSEEPKHSFSPFKHMALSYRSRVDGTTWSFDGRDEARRKVFDERYLNPSFLF